MPPLYCISLIRFRVFILKSSIAGEMVASSRIRDATRGETPIGKWWRGTFANDIELFAEVFVEPGNEPEGAEADFCI